METKLFIKWCKENKKELEKFVDIEFNKKGFDWLLSYRMSHIHLKDLQKVLSEKLSSWLRELDGIA